MDEPVWVEDEPWEPWEVAILDRLRAVYDNAPPLT